MSEEPTLEIVRLDDFKPDPGNVNLHTPAGKELTRKSIRKHKFGRPGLASEDGVIAAGNLSIMEIAREEGAEEVVVVRTNGDRPVIHVRTDLESDSDEFVAIALEDNATAAASLQWDKERMAALPAELLEGVFTPEQLQSGEIVAVDIEALTARFNQEQEKASAAIGDGMHQERKRSAERLMVHIENPDALAECAAAIRELLAENPEWQAKVSG